MGPQLRVSENCSLGRAGLQSYLEAQLGKNPLLTSLRLLPEFRPRGCQIEDNSFLLAFRQRPHSDLRGCPLFLQDTFS